MFVFVYVCVHKTVTLSNIRTNDDGEHDGTYSILYVFVIVCVCVSVCMYIDI